MTEDQSRVQTNEFNQYSPQSQEPAKPYNELEFALLTIDPSWGKEVTQKLREKLQDAKLEAAYEETDDKGEKTGNVRIPIDDLWSLLAMYTKDVRLGNLNMWEQQYVEEQLDIASDCLAYGFIRSFVRALSRAVTKLEVSQSKGGFLRKRSNTFTKEEFKTEKKDNLKRNWIGKPVE